MMQSENNDTLSSAPCKQGSNDSTECPICLNSDDSERTSRRVETDYPVPSGERDYLERENQGWDLVIGATDLATCMYLDHSRVHAVVPKTSRTAHRSIDMCFQLALNLSVPSVQVLFGADGNRPYPKTLQNTRVLDIEGFFSILHAENIVMRDFFLKAITIGYAHQTGMRKITDMFKKGPKLYLVDTRDDKSVFIPQWIHRFKLDVKKVRREEVKYQQPIQVKAPIPTDYPSECIFDSMESNPHNVSQPVIETIVSMEDC
ncbi:hypothetical protein TNCV_3389971 [Trichonephila clavipes]|nr:hypothetical protein TNCV_3389971 [Trichonephila clavipes]